MHRDILPGVIFSPGELALELAAGLERQGARVTLYTPGPVETSARNVTADLQPFEDELKVRGDSYIGLLKKHPMIFVSLARQVQAEIIARAFADANAGDLDVVHVYANEEDIALPFARFCRKPVVFTHHDPFDFLVKYKRNFPKYRHLSWISMSLAQRQGMPSDTNWVGNIYHGVAKDAFIPRFEGESDYFLYLGRIVEPKGVHLAIGAVKRYNQTAPKPLRLLVAGKHYSGNAKDDYWQKQIEPELNGSEVQYVGFVRGEARREVLAGARALMMPSVFDEPFGLSMVEALACGTPVVGLDSGAVPEVIRDGETGWVVQKVLRDTKSNKTGRWNSEIQEEPTVIRLAEALDKVGRIDRRRCRRDFEERFEIDIMIRNYLEIYRKLALNNNAQSRMLAEN